MSEETIYTFYRIDFKNVSSVEYDYTICETLEVVLDYLKMIDTDLHDPEGSASATITGIGMTKKEWNEFVKKLQP